MSIAEKLTKVAENVQKVYEAGQEDGKQTAYDEFWDSCQQNGTRTDYSTAFGGKGWNNETFKPKYDIVVDEGYMMFRYHNSGKIPYDLAEHLDNLGVRLILRYTAQYMFAYANVSRIPALDFTIGTRSMQQTFASCVAETIDKIIVNASSTYEGAFSNAKNLQNLIIEGTIGNNGLNLQWSTKLSKESITSVINALSSTTSGLSITLSATAVKNAFNIENLADDTTWGEDSEYYILRHSKDNWTISYV